MKLPSSSQTRTRHSAAIAALLVLGFGAAACGSDDNSADATTPAATTPAATQAPAPAATDAPVGTDAAVASGATVMTAESSLGTILVDGDGMTLYMFKPDNAGPSTCTGECLAAWPALTGPATAGTGADAAMLGTAARPDDGSEQVTYNGWPLYHFAQDKAPGDVTGQELNDKWYVVDATGTPVESDGYRQSFRRQ